MKNLEEILNLSSDGTFSDTVVLTCLEAVKERGDVFVLKADGERSNDQFTVFINRIGKEPGMLRHDGAELGKSVFEVFKQYVECEG